METASIATQQQRIKTVKPSSYSRMPFSSSATSNVTIC